jgi:hypothetical protein
MTNMRLRRFEEDYSTREKTMWQMTNHMKVAIHYFSRIPTTTEQKCIVVTTCGINVTKH